MATFIIGTLVIGSFVVVGHKVYKDKKNGNCCSGNCCDCHSSCKSTKIKIKNKKESIFQVLSFSKYLKIDSFLLF